MENLVEGQEYTINPDGMVNIKYEPGLPVWPALYNWREKAKGVDIGPPERQAPLVQQHSNNNGYNATASTNSKPRPPPPPYQAPKFPPAMEPSRVSRSIVPRPPPSRRPLQLHRPSSSFSLVPPSCQNLSQPANGTSPPPRPPNQTASQPHRPTNIDSILEGLGGFTDAKGGPTFNIQLILDERTEEILAEPEEQMEMGTEEAAGGIREDVLPQESTNKESFSEYLNDNEQDRQEGLYIREEHFQESPDFGQSENEVAGREPQNGGDYEIADVGGYEESGCNGDY
jgi:hypothetical protein